MPLDCSILQENLKIALSHLKSAVDKRATLPALKYVLIEADTLYLTLRTTDLEISIEVKVSCKLNQTGRALVPFEILNLIIKDAPKMRVDLVWNITTHTLAVTCGALTSDIKGLDPDEFPPLPNPTDWRKVACLQADQLQSAIASTGFSAATKDYRPILQTINCVFDAETLTLAAADSYRLAYGKLPLLDPAHEKIEINLPAKALLAAFKTLKKSTVRDEVTVSMRTSASGARYMRFEIATICFSFVELSGRFPDFTAIVSRQYDNCVSVDTSDFAQLIKMVKVFSRDNANIFNLIFDSGNKQLVAISKSVEYGEQRNYIGASYDTLTHLAISVGLNSRYLEDIIRQVKADKMTIQYNGPVKMVSIAAPLKGAENNSSAIQWNYLISPCVLPKDN